MPTNEAVGTIPARKVESRHRLRIVLEGKERDCTVVTAVDCEFRGTLVARRLHLRTDDGAQWQVDVNPDDELTRLVGE